MSWIVGCSAFTIRSDSVIDHAVLFYIADTSTFENVEAEKGVPVKRSNRNKKGAEVQKNANGRDHVCRFSKNFYAFVYADHPFVPGVLINIFILFIPPCFPCEHG